ncbi:MAG: LysR family transcriptional regulator, partial [Pseudoflavonifractor sp.]
LLNYTKAAAELHITQPAVTQHMQFLQAYYGVKLFDYRDKRLTLTPEGTLLRNASITMVHDEQKLHRDLNDMRFCRQSIRFGATLTIGEYALPQRLAAYMKRHPEVDVHMIVDNTHALLHQLNEGILDFAMVEGYFLKAEYDYLLWSLEPYICVCAAQHPLIAASAARPLQLADLFHENLILRDVGSGSREVLVRTLEGKNHQFSDFHHVVEISDLLVIKELVKAGCGITFLYRKAVEAELAAGSICQVPLSDLDVSHEFTFLWRKNSIFEPEFRALFQEFSADLPT